MNPGFLVDQTRPTGWKGAGWRYHAYSFYLRQRYGGRVQRISLDGGMSCPNVDGQVGLGGCIFCDNRSFSPSRRGPESSIPAQLEAGIRRLRARFGCERFVAYLQPSSNTYGDVARLREIYDQAISHPQVVGLAIGTRPDCVPEPVLDLLTEFAERTCLSVEFGLQTIHERSLTWLQRGHDYGDFLRAVECSRGRGYRIGAHVILGIPGETGEDMQATARELARLDLDSVKIHNLYAVRNTPLEALVQRGEVRFMERPEFVCVAADFIESLSPCMVIERVGGSAPPEFLIGPTWCQDKAGLQAALRAELVRRDSWQGRHWRS